MNMYKEQVDINDLLDPQTSQNTIKDYDLPGPDFGFSLRNGDDVLARISDGKQDVWIDNVELRENGWVMGVIRTFRNQELYEYKGLRLNDVVCFKTSRVRSIHRVRGTTCA
jgi:hypothetical protein